MRFDLDYFENLTNQQLVDIAMMEAMWILGKNEVLPEFKDEIRSKQADLYAALVNRLARYDSDIHTQVREKPNEG
jgi:hypothetical protein